jgi:hypothetical protein
MTDEPTLWAKIPASWQALADRDITADGYLASHRRLSARSLATVDHTALRETG